MKTTRRSFIGKAIKASVITTVGGPYLVSQACASVPSSAPSHTFEFTQLPLPYAYHELEPSIDALTMEIHYLRHHAAYIKNVNDAIAAEKIEVASAADFFSRTSTLSAKARNNGGGAWNHNFFWTVMKPNGGGPPSGNVAEALTSSFGSFEKFKELFTAAALTRFGSGWAWLVKEGSQLKIGSTPNQDNPLMDVSDLKGTPLLALDVWEHAYYLKYQNKRNEYVANWWNTIHWDTVAGHLGN